MKHLARFLTPLNSHTATRLKGVLKKKIEKDQKSLRQKQMAISVQIASRGLTLYRPQRRKSFEPNSNSFADDYVTP